MNNDISGLISVNEVYFGKTKELLEIEDLIGQIRAKYGMSSAKGQTAVQAYFKKGDRAKTNSSPEMLKINRLFEKAFGFESFFLMVIHMGTQNAMTMPVSGCIDAPEDTHKIQASVKGFKKSGHDKTFVCIYDGIFFNEKLSNAEVLGVILHEIGHNFQTAISPVCRGFSYIDRIIKVIMIPVSIATDIMHGKIGNAALQGIMVPTIVDKSRQKIVVNYKKALESNPEYIESINATQLVIGGALAPVALIGSIKRIVTVLARGLMPIKMFIDIIVNSLSSIALNGLDERGEIIADKFATAYGYGAECQSALVKCRDMGFGMPTEAAMRKIPILNAYYDLLHIPYQILGNIIDCHPEQIARSKYSLDMLNKELAKEDLDPKLRAEIKTQTLKLQKNIDELTDMTKTGFMFTNAWSALMLTLFNGDAKAMLFNKGTDEDFERAFNNNLEEVKRGNALKKG